MGNIIRDGYVEIPIKHIEHWVQRIEELKTLLHEQHIFDAQVLMASLCADMESEYTFNTGDKCSETCVHMDFDADEYIEYLDKKLNTILVGEDEVITENEARKVLGYPLIKLEQED